MKRKIFSKLLMGAFLFASVSAFVSCKDYDDDINANKAEIKAVQDQLTTLTSNLNSLKTELQTQKTALQQELATAKSQLETQIADAKAQLTTAIEKKADQATVDALATRVANLETNLAALNAAYEAKMAAVDSALASLQAIIDKKADITYVDNAIAILNSAIEGKVAKEDFGAFKSEVNTLQNDLNNLTTLVNSKADQKDIDHAVEKINEKLAALAEQMKTTVPQSDIANMQETIKALQDHVNSLIQAVTAKVEQSAFDQLNAFYKELKEQVNTLVTPEQLASAIATLKEEIEKKGAEESARLDEAIAKVQKAVDDNKAAGDKALKDAVDEINTALGTKASVDDLTEAKKEFNKAIEELNTNILAKLAAVSGDITKTNEKIDEINEALDAKIKENAKNLSDFETAFGKLNLDERVAACEALIEQVDAINLFLGELKEGGLAKILKDLQKEMSEDAAKKVAAEAEDRAKAIEDVYTEIGNVQEKLNNEIAELNNKLYGEGEVKGDIDKLKADTEKLTEDFSKIDEKVQNKVNENLSNLVLFVSRSLKSISLVPQLFIGGIEAIEFTSLQYYAIQPGTSGLTTRDAVAAELKVDRTSLNYKESQPAVDANKKYIQILTDNGLAEAYYRLNPSKVDRSSIDEDNIEFLAATAETRAASVESPVEFNGIAEWPAKGVEGKTNGLIKVNLRKTAAYRNKSLNQDPIFIVALKMPRKATKVAGQDVEAADIVSENSRLAERVMIPKIARLEWNTDETKKFYDADKKAVGNVKVHHYTDSVTMWAQRIDKTELVYDSVEYNKSYDVLSRVTGCDVSVAGKHTPISKEDLKKYGLTFRFGIPTKAYNDVDHSTDQQQFASIDPVKGIVTSKIPNNEVNNRACVGKEPIIRIMLVDTLNNQLVDERYTKIKWIEKELKAEYLGEFTDKTQLVPCDVNEAHGILWKDFINRVYAVVTERGISQETFEAVYPVSKVKKSDVLMSWDGKDWTVKNNGKYLSPALNPGSPVVDPTMIKKGDALIVDWTLQPKEIADIHPHQQKIFKSTITFKSILPTEYPDLYLDYIWTIEIVPFPVIEGYYDNYWLTKYSEHDVLPVQYNTAMYYNIADGVVVPGKDYGLAGTPSMELYDKANNKYFPGTDYCVFYNNLTNYFKYHLVSDKAKFIINDINNCQKWDMQFTMAGKDQIEKIEGYTTTYTQAKPNGKQYKNAYGQSPSLMTGINWKTSGAYKLLADNNKQALQLEWWADNGTGLPDQTDGNHTPWDSKLQYKFPMLYADHHNAANQALLNPLESNKYEKDGWTPLRTHDKTKAIHMGIWATLNDWNISCIKDYDFYLIEPLRINTNLDGCFEEGYISGTCIKNAEAFNMRDFRGYEVAKDAAKGDKATKEQYKYQAQLYKYYEVGTPVWKLDEVKYGMEVKNGNVVASETKTMTAAEIKKHTNGNIILSITKETYLGEEYLVFKNNGGSNVEEEVWVYLPVSVDYGFGTITSEVKVKLYPKGVGKGVPYPGA